MNTDLGCQVKLLQFWKPKTKKVTNIEPIYLDKYKINEKRFAVFKLTIDQLFLAMPIYLKSAVLLNLDFTCHVIVN